MAASLNQRLANGRIIFLVFFILIISIIYYYFRQNLISDKEISKILNRHEYILSAEGNIRYLTYQEKALQEFNIMLYAYEFGLLLVSTDDKNIFTESIFLFKHKIYKDKFKNIKLYGQVITLNFYKSQIIIVAKTFGFHGILNWKHEFVINFNNDDYNMDIITKFYNEE